METAELLQIINDLTRRVAELESKMDTKAHKQHKELDKVECEICHKTFKNKYILKTHMQNIHSETRERYECPHCNKEFASKYYLKKHISSKHPDEGDSSEHSEHSEHHEEEE